MMPKIGLISLGCAKNLVNSEQMLYLLREAGFEITGDTDGVDAVVVNTCGFIESAKTEAIETILELGEIKARGGIKKIIAAGCLAQRYQDEILRELPEIDAIVGTGSYGDIVEAVKSALDGRRARLLGDINAPCRETPRIVTTSAAWAYIKIAEGCSNRCSYCVIPELRGGYRSRPIENIIAEAETIVRDGVRELIIIAQDVTGYGADLYGERRLPELLERLCEIDGVRWIRPHYLYPDGVGDELISVIAKSDKIVKYFDIPIQHINDGILKSMRRRGTGGDIRRLFARIRQRVPGAVIRTSLITGLPGEGETEFEELCEFLREAKIERAGVFPYSPEEGTPAALMDRPDARTAVRRAELAADIQSRIMDEFNASRVGCVIEALIEGYEDGRFFGRSYAESPEIDGRVLVAGGDMRLGDFVLARVTGEENGELLCEKI